MAQLVEPGHAQVMISLFVDWSPKSCSVLTACSEPGACFRLCLLSLPLPRSCSVSVSQKDINVKKKFFLRKRYCLNIFVPQYTSCSFALVFTFGTSKFRLLFILFLLVCFQELPSSIWEVSFLKVRITDTIEHGHWKICVVA